jgi:hypothetical protein
MDWGLFGMRKKHGGKKASKSLLPIKKSLVIVGWNQLMRI